MTPETKAALELFVEKADKLASLSFLGAADEGLELTYSGRLGEPHRIESKGPTAEQVDAFLLTFRFFIQENEHTSFRWLAKNVLDDPRLSEVWKDEFRAVRSEMNRFLDETLSMPIVFDGKASPTNREVMDTIIFGDRSHATPEKRPKLASWMSHPLARHLFLIQFTGILRQMLEYIVYIADRSREELKRSI